MDTKDLDHRFTYHPPRAGMTTRFATIRDQAATLAYVINDEAPDGREKSLAITKLEEVVFWANAAIARSREDGD